MAPQTYPRNAFLEDTPPIQHSLNSLNQTSHTSTFSSFLWSHWGFIHPPPILFNTTGGYGFLPCSALLTSFLMWYCGGIINPQQPFMINKICNLFHTLYRTVYMFSRWLVCRWLVNYYPTRISTTNTWALSILIIYFKILHPSITEYLQKTNFEGELWYKMNYIIIILIFWSPVKDMILVMVGDGWVSGIHV